MAELILIYGGTGSWKTAQAHFLAKYVYERWGKTTRLGSCDGGGWKPLEPDVAAGLIEAWNVSAIESPRSVLRKLSQGYWPKPNPAGKLVLQPPSPQTWEQVGCEVVEGLTSIANVIMRDALNKQMIVAGDQAGDTGAIKFSEKVTTLDIGGRELPTEEKFSFATRGNFLDAQKAVYDVITNYRSLPVPYVYVTALEARGEEEDTKKSIIGPQVIGKAVTAQVGSWVGDQIHAEDYYVTVDDPSDPLTRLDEKARAGKRPRQMQQTKVRMWFTRHPDPVTGMLFPAKPRVAPELYPALLDKFPGGYFEPTTEHGLDAYLEVVEALQQAATDNLKRWKAERDAERAAQKVEGGEAQPVEKELVKATIAPVSAK